MKVQALFILAELATWLARLALDFSDRVVATIDRLQRGESKEST